MKCEYLQNDKYKTCGLDLLVPCDYLIATKRCQKIPCEGACSLCQMVECSERRQEYKGDIKIGEDQDKVRACSV